MSLPLRILWRDPTNLGSADAVGACKCDDGMEYVLKDTTSCATTPHDEWFCTKLAEAVHIACPMCAVVEDGANMLFGSRYEGGLAKDPWWEMVARGEIDSHDLSDSLSRILAFDHFVHNDDRHLNNYLVRETRNGWVVLAFDFSRAWLSQGFPLPDLPFTTTKNTRLAYTTLRDNLFDYLDHSSVDKVLDLISQTSEHTIRNIISAHPQSWLTKRKKSTILKWWRSAERQDRIERIRRGLRDGSYL